MHTATSNCCWRRALRILHSASYHKPPEPARLTCKQAHVWEPLAPTWVLALAIRDFPLATVWSAPVLGLSPAVRLSGCLYLTRMSSARGACLRPSPGAVRGCPLAAQFLELVLVVSELLPGCGGLVLDQTLPDSPLPSIVRRKMTVSW